MLEQYIYKTVYIKIYVHILVFNTEMHIPCKCRPCRHHVFDVLSSSYLWSAYLQNIGLLDVLASELWTLLSMAQVWVVQFLCGVTHCAFNVGY